jgi:hypothetical protein
MKPLLPVLLNFDNIRKMNCNKLMQIPDVFQATYIYSRHGFSYDCFEWELLGAIDRMQAGANIH